MYSTSIKLYGKFVIINRKAVLQKFTDIFHMIISSKIKSFCYLIIVISTKSTFQQYKFLFLLQTKLCPHDY